jgi:hypothetical protein
MSSSGARHGTTEQGACINISHGFVDLDRQWHRAVAAKAGSELPEITVSPTMSDAIRPDGAAQP